MYAIVREGNGKYYTSTVFGYYNTSNDPQDYHHKYWVVLNREKTALINQNYWGDGIHGIVPTVLAVDSDRHDWVLDNKYAQSMAFLPTDRLFNMIETNTVPADILQKCIDLDKEYTYEPYPEIVSEKDIINFEDASGVLHDAFISEIKQNDDSLYVLFKGEWGCDVEVWFTGDVKYDISAQNSSDYGKYWYCCTVVFKDGYVYLLEDDTPKIETGGCWFRARHMKYHIIPE